jgi:flagellar hook-basal body complex protein FliE
MDNSFSIGSIGTGRGEGPLAEKPFQKPVKAGGPDKTSFSDMFKSFLKDVNHMQNHAGDSIQKMIAGEITDPHQVMLAVGEAKMALNLLIEIRNKVMEAYREIIQIRV